MSGIADRRGSGEGKCGQGLKVPRRPWSSAATASRERARATPPRDRHRGDVQLVRPRRQAANHRPSARHTRTSRRQIKFLDSS